MVMLTMKLVSDDINDDDDSYDLIGSLGRGSPRLLLLLQLIVLVQPLALGEVLGLLDGLHPQGVGVQPGGLEELGENGVEHVGVVHHLHLAARGLHTGHVDEVSGTWRRRRRLQT